MTDKGEGPRYEKEEGESKGANLQLRIDRSTARDDTRNLDQGIKMQLEGNSPRERERWGIEMGIVIARNKSFYPFPSQLSIYYFIYIYIYI